MEFEKVRLPWALFYPVTQGGWKSFMNFREGPHGAGRGGWQEPCEVWPRAMPTMGNKMLIPAGWKAPASSDHGLCQLLIASGRYGLGKESRQLLAGSKTSLCPSNKHPACAITSSKELCFCLNFVVSWFGKKREDVYLTVCMRFRRALNFPSVTPSIFHSLWSCVDCLQINENEM